MFQSALTENSFIPKKLIFVVQENNKSEWAYPGKKSFVDFKISF